MPHGSGRQNAQDADGFPAIGTRLLTCFDTVQDMLQFARQRHGLFNGDLFRFGGLEIPMVALAPDFMAIKRKLPAPRLHVIKHRHTLRANNAETALTIGIKA